MLQVEHKKSRASLPDEIEPRHLGFNHAECSESAIVLTKMLPVMTKLPPLMAKLPPVMTKLPPGKTEMPPVMTERSEIANVCLAFPSVHGHSNRAAG